ncbi:MAG TPA: YhjD/YihY/BrkB family envelope integrity protein [Acidimicrobiales bacterium]|nr:YhjD/YihY/BrkB family envelope integrity protein [Acidimicrobiales bacterium]
MVDVAPVASGALSDGGGLWAAVARSRAQVTAGQARLNDLIDKYHDRAVLDVALRIFQRDREAAGTIVGSALAFRLFLFFVPVVLFFVGLIGFLAQWTGPHELNQTAGLTGTLAAQIDTALTQPNTTRWIAVVAGLVGMVWAGRSLSKVMVSASCLAWRLPITTKATVRLIGGIVGLVVGIALVCAITNRVRRDLGLGAASLSFIAVFALYGLAWMAMSMLLPRATKDPGALLPGAVLVGGLLAAMQAVAQLYLPDKLDRTSALYGAIGTTIVTLGWFFLLGRGMVLGMSLNAVIYERFGSISQFVFGLPVIRVLPRKSAWTRDFFDLER